MKERLLEEFWNNYLPTGSLHGIQNNERYKKNITRDDNEHGYSLECDLEWPPIVLEKTENFPFFPGKKTFKSKKLSTYTHDRN